MELPPPPLAGDPDALARVREALEAARYTHEGLAETIGIKRVTAELYVERMEFKIK